MSMKISRRDVLKLSTAAGLLPSIPWSALADDCGPVDYLPVTLDQVPLPKVIPFAVRFGSGAPITLYGHYWYSASATAEGKKCPAIVEFNPYRRRDGTMHGDSKMYPWFAANGYLCFRIDLQGTGDSEGAITDEYTEEELSYCVQVIEQIARLPFCDGNVGMMGKSWSAINSLMVAARRDCPAALKAILFCAGSDDRFEDDVHYMGGAMMLDNTEWPSNMWGWLTLPPDPIVVGDRWREQWRARIRAMDFWFKQWAEHQTRDAYWAKDAVRGHYDQVKVPVFTLSGWQDGYRNVTERQVRALGALGRPVSGLLGPWGHKYAFGGYPGPRIEWLRYVAKNWWDRWLKGIAPDPARLWPELVVWMGESRPPRRNPGFDAVGQWAAEDHNWPSRTKERRFTLWPDNRLSPKADASAHDYVSRPDIMLGTAALETSSWGECGNDDLPADTDADDKRSIWLDSEPLTEDLPCFGYPRVELNVECDNPVASLAIRLCEVSPEGDSHLVTFTFFNLCYRGGDMAKPEPIRPGPFAIKANLNIMGHVFKRGWRLRLSVSPHYFPTLWTNVEIATIRIKTGRVGGNAESALVLPGRDARAEDRRIQTLIGPPHTEFLNADQYVPAIRTIREGSATREAKPFADGGRKGMKVRKHYDSGSAVFGGGLDGLLVDQTFEEEVVIFENDPLSHAMTTRSEAKLKRGASKTRAEAKTRI